MNRTVGRVKSVDRVAGTVTCVREDGTECVVTLDNPADAEYFDPYWYGGTGPLLTAEAQKNEPPRRPRR